MKSDFALFACGLVVLKLNRSIIHYKWLFGNLKTKENDFWKVWKKKMSNCVCKSWIEFYRFKDSGCLIWLLVCVSVYVGLHEYPKLKMWEMWEIIVTMSNGFGII